MVKLILQPIPGHRYRVVEPFRYQNIQVPAGFVTDGANVPRPFWFIWPPNKSDFMKAVVIHDYLCDRENYSLADQLFKEALQEAGATKVTVWLFHTSVDLRHRIKYPSHYNRSNP
jgi:Protein of unknown function (DUF1353)